MACGGDNNESNTVQSCQDKDAVVQPDSNTQPRLLLITVLPEQLIDAEMFTMMLASWKFDLDVCIRATHVCFTGYSACLSARDMGVLKGPLH